MHRSRLLFLAGVLLALCSVANAQSIEPGQTFAGKVASVTDGELHHLEYSGKPVDAETLCADCHAEKDPHRHVG